MDGDNSWTILAPDGIISAVPEKDLAEALGGIVTRLADKIDSGGHEPPEGKKWFRVGVSRLGGSAVLAP